MDRRPIKARELAISNRAAEWLAARHVSPNLISIFGGVAGIFAGLAYAVTPQWKPAFLIAAFFILVRLTCNMLDGMVAVLLGKPSPLGEIFNEFPDRISDTATLIGFGFAYHSSPVLGAIAAAAAMLTAYTRVLGKSIGAPMEFCGPMAKQQRMALLMLVSLPLAFRVGWPKAVLWIIILGSLATCARRLSRIVQNTLNALPR